MSHDNHHHKLELKSANCPYYCGQCNQLGFGLSYTCVKSECNIFYHKLCESPQTLIMHPFSTKCVLKFYPNKYGKESSCDVCGKKIKGYHCKCLCNFVTRHVHPSCLSYEPALVAIDGLTLNLKKVATSACLHCGNMKISSKVPGWAYVSSCGDYCYHVSCVMDIINRKWKNGLITGESDPFQTIRPEFLSDVDKRQQLVIGKKKEKSMKKAATILSAIFNVLTGNSLGLVGNAQKYFFG
ncbi:hypothetical protein CTI12_AA612760 [Artemisia annua]|uniref:DC1 domain-containing protein n=1 Tax=Artemisia annua TaxID=35608 RepID=A0A2U1KE16_ARTAN|nr:hypothetical protein CTI12_AA612760 [Artemisia annua]